MAKRRGNNEGSIYRRKDGYWVGQYGIETPTGRKTRYIYGKRREEAREKLTKAIADRDGGFIVDDENMSVGEYLKRWLDDSVRGSVRASTHASYERQVGRYIGSGYRAHQARKAHPSSRTAPLPGDAGPGALCPHRPVHPCRATSRPEAGQAVGHGGSQRGRGR